MRCGRISTTNSIFRHIHRFYDIDARGKRIEFFSLSRARIQTEQEKEL